MTLEIEYSDGEIHGVAPERFRFYPKSKKMILNMPKPYLTIHCSNVERKVTNSGITYNGSVDSEGDKIIKLDKVRFFLYL